MSRIVKRFGSTQTLTGEAWLSYDGQGKPAYDSGVDFEAIVQEGTVFTNRNAQAQGPDPAETVITLRVWVSPDADFVPDEKDRITFNSGAYIVYESKPVRDIRSAAIRHHRLMCTDE